MNRPLVSRPAMVRISSTAELRSSIRGRGTGCRTDTTGAGRGRGAPAAERSVRAAPQLGPDRTLRGARHLTVARHVGTLKKDEDPCTFHCFSHIHHMLKSGRMVKAPEIRAVDAVRDLLDDVPSVEVESIECQRQAGPDYRVGALIGLSYPGGTCALVVEVKPNGAPRFVRSGVHRLESFSHGWSRAAIRLRLRRPHRTPTLG